MRRPPRNGDTARGGLYQEQNMDFRITGLESARFAELTGLNDSQLAAHNARRVVADRHPGFPCRVSLIDAAPGESVLLVSYEHLAVDSPYRSRHAIYVRENARDAHLEVNEIPPVLHGRLLSLRAFSPDGMLLDADVAQNGQLVPTVERLLSDPRAAFLHVHNARPGCFAARVDRA
jgi:hypothetical protein